MPQLEIFLYGDQFLVILSLYVIFFFFLLVIEYFMVYKLFVYNFLSDSLSKENLINVLFVCLNSKSN